jgi:cytochrome b6
LTKHRNLPSWEAIRAGAADWIGQRVDLAPLAAALQKKTVPIHRHSWIYLLGGGALFLFAFQVLTGVLLMLYYQPAELTAHESVERIMTQVPYGWLVRSMHAWGASLFIGLSGLHLLTVLFSRAYRRPRELTWLSGTLLLFLALGFGFSGYLLPWNELAYYATLVGSKIPTAIPLAGEFVVHWLRGGPQVSGDTITRFCAAHVLILPLAFAAVLLVHLALIQAQGMSLPLGLAAREVRDHRPFFSEFVLIDCGVWLLLLGLTATLAVFLPAELGVKADVLRPPPPGIKPEWYFLFLFQVLKHVPEPVGVALFAAGAAFLVAIPFLDRHAGRERASPRFTALLAVLLLAVLVLEAQAWLAPGMKRAAEQLRAPSYSLAGGAVSLALLWSVIGFLLYYLRQLLRENARVRKLYRCGAHDPP